ncbi:MAG: carbohydrate kinase [Pseudomonadota bacterium]
MADVLCLGEILVDWICTIPGAELGDAHHSTKAPGGAPANTAVGLARQGISTGFIGRVSDDAFGSWLISILEQEGIDIEGTFRDPEAQTRMAYVVTTLTGDRKLAEFTRIACADARLTSDDLRPHQFAKADILHFGSISLISDTVAKATQTAVELARKNNLLVSYDPNVRLGLWPSEEICKQTILDTLKWADLIKINEDELAFLTGSRDLEAADTLREEHAIPMLIITLDSRGSYFTTAKGSRLVPGFSVNMIEATGAGDGFNAGVLAGLLHHVKKSNDSRQMFESLSLDTLSDIIRRGNAIGALTCMQPGAMPALPYKEDIDSFLLEQRAANSEIKAPSCHTWPQQSAYSDTTQQKAAYDN